MLVKPRFGRRRWSGIWPPSKPLMATPVRAFWPLTPRPAVLPLPDPMPRPTRMRAFREPGLSAISLSFMTLLPFLDHADEVADLVDHAAHGRGVLQRAPAADLVEAEADQRRRWIAGRRIGLPICSTVMVLSAIGQASLGSQASTAASASMSRRRAWSVDTLMPRRAATPRGLSSCFRASKVARTMLYGIGRAERLRHHVLDAERLEDGAHRTAGDDAGAGRRRAADRPCRRRGARSRHGEACGPRGAAPGPASAWPPRSPCGSPRAPRAPCRGRSRPGPSGRPRRRAPRNRSDGHPSPPWRRG